MKESKDWRDANGMTLEARAAAFATGCVPYGRVSIEEKRKLFTAEMVEFGRACIAEVEADRDRLRAALVKIIEQKYWHHDGTRVTNAHALDIARAALAGEGGAR